MFITRSLEALGYYDDNTIREVRNIIDTPQRRVYYLRNNQKVYNFIGPALIATLLTLKDFRINCETYHLSRSVLSSANLQRTTLTPYDPNTANNEHIAQIKKIVQVLTNYTSYKDECSNLIFLHSASGLTNAKRWLKTAGYEPINIAFNSYHSHKIDVYKLQNTVLIFTNDILESQLYRKLVGWLPILFKEAFTNLRDYPELHTYYKTCFETGDVNLDLLKKIPVIKNIKDTLKHKQIDKFIKDIEQSQNTQLNIGIDQTRTEIKEFEEHLNMSYKKLVALQKQQATGTAIENSELITQFLKNNPNVQGIILANNILYFALFGPVDYDKNKLKPSLKNQDPLIKWMLTNPDYMLCWESVCVIDLNQNKIDAERRLTSNTGRLRNTHWHAFQCFGNNRIPIEKALINKDYFSALTQIITAAQLLNVYDIVVLEKLIYDLTSQHPNHIAFYDPKTDNYLSAYQLKRIYETGKETLNDAQ